MMTPAFYRGLLLGTALIAGMPLSAAARCRQIGEPLWVIDGRQHTLAELSSRNLSRDSVEAFFSYYCWNPADSTFHWSRGPRDLPAGFAVVRIVTKDLVDRLIDELYRVSEAASLSSITPSTVVGPPVRGAV